MHLHTKVQPIIQYLLADRKVARAAHPVIHAWRCEVNGTLHQDNDDDGETAAGARLAHLIQILASILPFTTIYLNLSAIHCVQDMQNVLVIVTRYFGGIHLGPDRFKHINAAARDAIERAGLLDDHPGKTKSGKKKKAG